MKFQTVLLILAAAVLLCACGGSYRNGVGPYDFSDYGALDAIQDMRDYRFEKDQYSIEDYYDSLWEASATEAASEALSEYLYEEYLRETYGE